MIRVPPGDPLNLHLGSFDFMPSISVNQKAETNFKYNIDFLIQEKSLPLSLSLILLFSNNQMIF